MRCDDRSILNAGFPCGIRICVDIVLIESDDQADGRIVSAGSYFVDLCQSLFRLNDIDVLLLKVLCGGGKTAGFKDGFYLLRLDLA